MPEIIKIKDNNNLIPTSQYPLMSFPFEHFNPVQSSIFDYYDSDANLVIAARTSAGKTVVAEMMLAYEYHKRGGKGMYIGPLKALSQEKIDDWSDPDHDFSKLNLSICTGDYRLTPDRKNELSKSDLIVMTSEMLNSRVRNINSENNDWLKQVGTLVTDESHLLTVPIRGDKLEVALMKMSYFNKNCRHIFLSATMPNVSELAEWLTKLNGKDTVILESEYRPCPLERHYVPYNDSHWKYDWKEREKVNTALDIVKKFPNDKFLIFAHTKRTGVLMQDALKAINIDAPFHSSDLDKKKRVKVENDFRNNPNNRVIVATSSLAWGANFPARRVIILGVHRGLSEVETYDIDQMCGRAGRPRYDKKGTVYILLPNKDQGKQRLRLENPTPIRSQLVKYGSDDHRVLAFHVVNEIHQGFIKKREDVFEWHSNTFSYHQRRNLEDHIVEDMIDQLIKRQIITESESGELEVTAIGKIASLFYYSPYDVADLKRNLNTLFDYNKELDEVWIATALAKVNSNAIGIVNVAEMEQLEAFTSKLDYNVRNAFGNMKGFSDHVVKVTFCYYSLLNGFHNPALAMTMRTMQADSDRLVEVITAIDSMSGKWDKSNYFKKLKAKLRYGVQWRLLDLCDIKGLGKVKATKLWQAGIQNSSAILSKPQLTQSALKCSDKVLEKILTEAARVKNG